jgi:hypothetical protein
MDTGEILLRKGVLDARQLELARAAQSDGSRLDQAAVQLGFTTEAAALRALGEEFGLEFVDLAETEIDLGLLQDFPVRFIHREALFPIRRADDTLVVATSDPFNLYPLDELSAATGLTVVPVLAGREEIAKRIKSHLGVGSETIDSLLAQTSRPRPSLMRSQPSTTARAGNCTPICRRGNRQAMAPLLPPVATTASCKRSARCDSSRGGISTSLRPSTSTALK